MQHPQSKSWGNLNKKHKPPLTRLEEYIRTQKWSVKLPLAKFDAVPSPSRTMSAMGMNKRSNAQESTKSRQRSYSVENMDSDTDHIVASLDLEGIKNNYKTWNYLAMCKQMSLIPFLNVTCKPSTKKVKMKLLTN